MLSLELRVEALSKQLENNRNVEVKLLTKHRLWLSNDNNVSVTDSSTRKQNKKNQSLVMAKEENNNSYSLQNKKS